MDQLYIPKILLDNGSSYYCIIDHTLFTQEKRNHFRLS